MRYRPPAILTGVFALAFVTRLLPVLQGGGMRYYGRYDDGVYYMAAESLSFGHLPYRHFVLLQPPGITLALLPFVLLGRLTADPTGMAAARLAFMAVGALNAVLVALIASRWGWTTGAVAGLLYGTSAAAVYDEQATFVEPVGTLLTLVAVLALYRRTGRTGARLELLAGAALGFACATKIWYSAILAAVVLVTALGREIAAALRIVLGGAIAGAVVVLPFFVLAPGRMWTMVITDQLGRTAYGHRLSRVPNMLGTNIVFRGAGSPTIQVAAAVLVVLLGVALVFCLADRDTWMISILFLASAAVLMASPTYFHHYGTLVAAPLALIIPVGLGKALRRLPGAAVRATIVTCAVVLVLASGTRVALKPTGKSFPADAFAAAAPAGCIAADDPAALIQMNRLTQGFRSHCDMPVDITGASYGSPLPRASNTAFQNWLVRHLTRSDAFVVMRADGDQLSTTEKRVLRRHRLLARAPGVVLREGTGTP